MKRPPLVHTARAQVEQVIRVINGRGAGVDGDPIRNVTSYFTLTGELLVEMDPSIKAAGDMPAVLETVCPMIGSVWTWEPDKPHARCEVTVTAIRWNGEEAHVESRDSDKLERVWNTLSRWIEAAVYVRGGE